MSRCTRFVHLYCCYRTPRLILPRLSPRPSRPSNGPSIRQSKLHPLIHRPRRRRGRVSPPPFPSLPITARLESNTYTPTATSSANTAPPNASATSSTSAPHTSTRPPNRIWASQTASRKITRASPTGSSCTIARWSMASISIGLMTA